jgi:polar amino acid transport system substrate-binding protein
MTGIRPWTVLALVATLALGIVAAGCGDDEESAGDTESTGITSTDDLAGKIVGAQDGTTGEDYANKETDAEEVRGFPEGPDAIAALRTGQVDAVIIDQPVAVEALEKQGGIEIAEEIPTDELYGFPMAPDNTGLQQAVNGALTEIKEDGTLADLYEKYFQTEPPETVLDANSPDADSSAEPGLIEEGTLMVGTDTPYEPFEIGQPPNISGYDIEVMDAVAEKLGLTAEYQDTSFDTIFRDVAAGQFDIVAAASTITPAREKTVTFSDPYYEAQQALVVPTE